MTLQSSTGLMACVALCGAAFAQTKNHVVTFEDNQAVLHNPGIGWHLYHNDGPFSYATRLEPADDLADFPGLTIVYIRVPWSYIEPEEGQFNWTVLDTPMQRWVERDKQIAFRFTCCESSLTYATPKWVYDSGAKGIAFDGINSPLPPPQLEPDYNDPVFLEKLGNFLKAIASRYDGDPDVAFIDIGSFGVWGECHTWKTSGKSYDFDTVKRHVDLHVKHFKKTQLVISDDCVDSGRGVECFEYARKRGVTLRDDSILVYRYYHDSLAQDVWPHMPVILESVDYPGLTEKWGDGSEFLEAVEDYHASSVSIHGYPRKFYEDNKELVHRMNMRMGYRLRLLEATWPRRYTIQAGSTISFEAEWLNAGVAPCLKGGHPAVTLKDSGDGIAAVFVDTDFNVRSLPVGPPNEGQSVRQRMEICALPILASGLVATMKRRPFIEPGRYDVYISVGKETGKPLYELPLDHGDGHRRYRIGTIEVEVNVPELK